MKEFSDKAIQEHLVQARKLPTPHSTVHLYPIDGAAHKVANDATAFSYRDANWAEVIVGVDGLATVYHAGDTDVFGDMAIIAKLYAPKVCILPIGDHFTMGAKGAALATELLKPQTIIPCHYKTFPLLAPSIAPTRRTA